EVRQERGSRDGRLADVALRDLDVPPVDSTVRPLAQVGIALGSVTPEAGPPVGTGGLQLSPQRICTMSSTAPPVDVKAAEDHLMRSLAVEGPPGREKARGGAVIDELKKVGVPASAIRFDKVHERIPVPTQTGNLFVDLPGTRKGPRLLFITHLDTVP